MAKSRKAVTKTRRTQFFLLVVIILLILSAGLFAYSHFFSSKPDNYLIENKYYGFKLQTPKNWIAEEKTIYSEDNITQILAQCKNDESSGAPVHEIGRFRFEDQKYPDGLGDSGSFPAGLSSGVILEISVNCVPDSIKSKIGNYSGNLKIAGEQTFEEFLNLPGFGKTASFSFLHNGFQYKINEYIYISADDKKNEDKIRENYNAEFDKITSSFKFVK